MAKRKAFALRVSPKVYDAVAKWAGDELRSVNGQIEYLLLSALRDSGRLRRGRAQPPAGEDGEH